MTGGKGEEGIRSCQEEVKRRRNDKWPDRASNEKGDRKRKGRRK